MIIKSFFCGLVSFSLFSISSTSNILAENANENGSNIPSSGNMRSSTMATDTPSIVNTYDLHGRITRSQSPDGSVTGYTYDVNGNLERIILPNGKTIQANDSKLNDAKMK